MSTAQISQHLGRKSHYNKHGQHDARRTRDPVVDLPGEAADLRRFVQPASIFDVHIGHYTKSAAYLPLSAYRSTTSQWPFLSAPTRRISPDA